MKSRTKSTALLLSGVMIGASLTPAVHAAENWLKATPSTQIFIVDGRNVDLEAYAINGSNYVKLRDIGKSVGFDVSYDAQFNAAVIDTSRTYQDENSREQPEEKQTVPKVEVPIPDYSQDANPVIFCSDLTREVYNSLRDAILHQDEILAGTYPNLLLPMKNWSSEISHVTSSFSNYPVYEPVLRADGTYLCDVCLPEAYTPAAEHTQAFIDGLAGLSDREKIEKLVWYVADRITYQVAYPGPEKVLTQDEQVPGCCAAYAYNLLFLCNRADIPCVLKVGNNHEWNSVYVNGEWWDVDVTANDCGDEINNGEYSTILQDPEERTGIYDEYPHITAFAQELLMPGSTK